MAGVRTFVDADQHEAEQRRTGGQGVAAHGASSDQVPKLAASHFRSQCCRGAARGRAEARGRPGRCSRLRLHQRPGVRFLLYTCSHPSRSAVDSAAEQVGSSAARSITSGQLPLNV